MNNSSNLKCWETMNCANRDCPARSEPETPCWEITKRNVAYHKVKILLDIIINIKFYRFWGDSSLKIFYREEALMRKFFLAFRD